MSAAEHCHAELMDGVYRYQRHVYDLTRKYYLLGRDRLIDGLAVPPGGTVLELGCGTGRNLVKAARALSAGAALRAGYFRRDAGDGSGRRSGAATCRRASGSRAATHRTSMRRRCSAGTASTVSSSPMRCR